MPSIFYFKKKQVAVVFVIVVLLVAGGLYLKKEKSAQVDNAVAQVHIVHMVTSELKSQTADGKEMEVYRWNPGTVVVNRGEKVKLSLYGVNGDSHPFMIEGMNIKGVVKKGKETVVTLQTGKKGIYRIICLSHPDLAHNGPMIGYIVVQ